MKAHLLFIGGEDHHLRIPFILALRDKGYRVSAAASGDLRPFQLAGIEFRRFHFSRFVDPLSDWRALQALRLLLRAADVDIAHAFDTKPGLLAPFAGRADRAISVIRTINGRGWLYSSTSLGALALRALYRPLQRFAATCAAATVFQNQADQAFFERNRLLGKGESVLIPGSGIDVEGFDLARARGVPRERLRQELGLTNAEVILTVARVTRQKGICTLLEAAALVHKARPSAKFLIVGPRDTEGPFAIRDTELHKHAGYVTALGPRADVPALLACADLFVFPTEYAEGLPRALMEAALCGLPIITTDLPGCREVIRDGWNGYLVRPRRPDALAEKIIQVLANSREAARLAVRGPDLIRQKFSLEEIVEQHCRLYDRQLAQRGKQHSAIAGAELGCLSPGGKSS
ncbi:MAG TPA: glycosyltransferase family 4 protein [Gemmataceae bacterium]|nr:glycosyltransferase family 4 protein [Gemmataceae bacterium]